MNIGYRWLRSLLPELTAAPEELAEILAMRGAPVEGVLHLGRGLGDIVLARVEAVRQHPNADRLSLCEVEAGEGVVHVVCGAPIVKAGAYYPFAPVGATLPGGMKIRKAKIRGEASVGMLCSEKELGLGRDSGGIMEIPGEWTPGESLVEALGLDDVRLDVEVTPNRGDLLSHVGVAREASPAGVAGIRLPEIPGLEAPAELRFGGEREGGGGSGKPGAPGASGDSGEAGTSGGSGETGGRGWSGEAGKAGARTAGSVPVSIEDPDLCSRYIGAVIRGVTVGPSPEWLAARLRSVGARPINNVVDATNYVLLELGHPLHAFDLDTLDGPEIRVRRARKGETIRTLDDVERKLDSGMLAICDASRPVAIAGVMGGADTEVSGKTRDILLECALFDPAATRSTRRALGMSTDASYRFERGVDPEGMEVAVRRAVEIILATAGGEAEPKTSDARARPYERLQVRLRPGRVERVLGVSFSPDQLREILEPLGFEISESVDGGDGGDGAEGALHVSVPGFRSYDVRREIDLIEEVARSWGYDRFPGTLGHFRPGTVPDDDLFQLQDELRALLVERGLMEAHTPAFAPEGEGEVAVQNPVSAEEGYLRRSLLPGLFRRTEHNFARGARSIRLFESGTVFAASGSEGELPHEETRLSVVLTGDREPGHWATPAAPVDLWEVKGLLEAILGRARLSGAQLSPIEAGAPGAPLEPGAAFEVRDTGGAVVGHAGRVAAGVVDTPAWGGDVWAIELVLPDAPGRPESPLFHPLPAFPGIARDLALIVPDEIAAERVAERVRENGGELLERVEIFDLYRGKGVPDGARSLAFRLHFRSAERTLADADVEPAMQRVDKALREELGVQPRGP